MVNNISAVQYYPGYSQQQVQPNLLWQVISSITQSNPMVLTTLNNHNYPAGVNVGFNIPGIFGMQQLNKLKGEITAVTSNTMTININSSNFSPFAYPSHLPSAFTSPTVFANASGPYLSPLPLPFGNQDSFEGTIYNNGSPGDLINVEM